MKRNKLLLYFILSNLLLLLSIGEPAIGQSISIARTGHNQITINNTSYHAISLKIGHLNAPEEIVIPYKSSYTTNFSLNNDNVRLTPFEVSYDINSFRSDSSQEIYYELSRKQDADKFSYRMSLLIALFQNDCQWEKFILAVKGLSFLFGIPTPLLDDFFSNLSYIDVNHMTCEEISSIALIAIQKTVKNTYKEAEEIRTQRIKTIFNGIFTHKNEIYYVSQFIRPQEMSSLEFSPYYTVGYHVNFFHNYQYPSDQKLLNTIPVNKEPYYGARLTFNSNLYDKYGKRKPYRRQYMVLDYFQAPSTYKTNSDSVFPEHIAYSWRFYSIGYGREYINTQIRGLSLLADAGLISNSFSKNVLDSNNRVINSTQKSDLKGIAIYFHFGTKIKLTKWLDLYGAYNTTLFNQSKEFNKKDLPSFRYFKFGLNIKFYSCYSYQY